MKSIEDHDSLEHIKEVLIDKEYEDLDRHYQDVWDHIVPHSESDHIVPAMFEWRYEEEAKYTETEPDCEFCGHKNLTIHFKIKNHSSPREPFFNTPRPALWIGSKCIQKYAVGIRVEGEGWSHDPADAGRAKKIQSKVRDVREEYQRGRVLDFLRSDLVLHLDDGPRMRQYADRLEEYGHLSPAQAAHAVGAAFEKLPSPDPQWIKVNFQRKKYREYIADWPEWRVKQLKKAADPSQVEKIEDKYSAA